MPVCEICSEELASESDMKTHLLLSHLEHQLSCPLCSLSGVSYDELHFHVTTAHREPEPRPCSALNSVNPGSSTRDAAMTTTKTQSDAPKPVASLHATCAANGTDKQKLARSVCTEGRRHDPVETERKSKQKRLSSPRKEKHFPCPMCSLVCTDCFVLQEHVEVHLRDQTAREGEFVCPLCPMVCSDSGSLQEHVELHLEDGTLAAAGELSEDLRLAQQLQEEEERKRKERESKREAEDFKQLQGIFGLDEGGGYRKQMERNMERAVSRGHMTPAEFHSKKMEMMECLASGRDDGRTRTTGLLSALYQQYQSESRSGVRVWLCAETDHFSTSEGDRGWGCGYRNFQMLLSSLQRMDTYTALNTLQDSVPSIPQVQELMERAWSEGVDPQGATHFNGRLRGTRAWIGATEIYSVLTTHRVRARIMDFHKPTGPNNTHPRLFEWVKNYFSLPSSRGARLPPRVVKTSLPPIYLQHQGHSRCIVGVEEKTNGSVCLLLFDPGCSPADARKLLNAESRSAAASRMRKFPNQLKHAQYQLVVVEGALTPEEKQHRINNSRTLSAEKIP